MPRIKKGREMLKLKSLSELSKVVPVPEGAFEPEAKLEVPSGAFDSVPSRRKGEYAAYVKFTENSNSKRVYATFVVVRSCMNKAFKVTDKDRFELVQGKAPHNEWFMIRPATHKRGNKIVSAGAVFHTTAYIDTKKMNPDLFYPMELVSKDGVLYAKLHPDLVPALR